LPVVEGRQLRRRVALAALCASLAGCHQRTYPIPADSGLDDGSVADAPIPLTLDISVTGCGFAVTAVQCSGPAPLTVTFAPVGSPAFTTFLWEFFDGSPSSTDRTPTHTYALPGVYDVKVTGAGTVGTASKFRPGLIKADPVKTGAPCDVDAQCLDGLGCVCKPGSGCGPAFSRGICSTSCATNPCVAGAVCAAPPLTATATGADAGAGGPICLADCGGGGLTCPAGFACQTIPGGGASPAWIAGCLPLGAANDFGTACRDAYGALDDASCTTGLCGDLGARGLCTAACDGAHPCPSGAACARIGGSTQLCLPACSTATPCISDPSLGCTLATSADAGADGGLTITAGDPGVAYCAPQ
jgi:PKD repeat protein